MTAKGYIFVSPRSDPGSGKRLDDPIFGQQTTMGACRPDLRRLVRPGDYMFVISGKTQGVTQYIIGGFAVDEKINALAAHARYPDLRLQGLEDGGKIGNIIVNAEGQHHILDHHPEHNFERRIQNYLVGRDQVYLETPKEVELGRARSLSILKDIFGKARASRVSEIVPRNRRLEVDQINELVEALRAIKTEASSVKSG